VVTFPLLLLTRSSLSCCIPAVSSALATPPGTVPLPRATDYRDVFWNKLVPVRTVRLLGVYGSEPNAAEAVELRRDGFQVIRIDASPDSAKMVQLKPVWNWAYFQLV
jgi:hypothetical protein